MDENVSFPKWENQKNNLNEIETSNKIMKYRNKINIDFNEIDLDERVRIDDFSLRMNSSNNLKININENSNTSNNRFSQRLSNSTKNKDSFQFQFNNPNYSNFNFTPNNNIPGITNPQRSVTGQGPNFSSNYLNEENQNKNEDIFKETIKSSFKGFNLKNIHDSEEYVINIILIFFYLLIFYRNCPTRVNSNFSNVTTPNNNNNFTNIQYINNPISNVKFVQNLSPAKDPIVNSRVNFQDGSNNKNNKCIYYYKL